MKKIITLFSLLSLVLLNFWACDTKETDELGPEIIIPKTTDQLIGEWKWERTWTGWIGVETPASRGYTETLILDKNNTFKRLRNGVVTDESHYYISKEKSTTQLQDSILLIHLMDKNKTKVLTSQPLYLMGSDTIMTIVQEPFTYCDHCPREYYVRKKAALIK